MKKNIIMAILAGLILMTATMVFAEDESVAGGPLEGIEMATPVNWNSGEPVWKTGKVDSIGADEHRHMGVAVKTNLRLLKRKAVFRILDRLGVRLSITTGKSPSPMNAGNVHLQFKQQINCGGVIKVVNFLTPNTNRFKSKRSVSNCILIKRPTQSRQFADRNSTHKTTPVQQLGSESGSGSHEI